MSAYADTSFLASLYMPDSNSAEAAARMFRLPLPVLLTPLVELELLNALQLRLFRKEVLSSEVRGAYGAFRADVQARILETKPFAGAVYTQARRLAAKWTVKLGTRTLDIIHVASAIVLGAETFETFDSRQSRLARAAGLITAAMKTR